MFIDRYNIKKIGIKYYYRIVIVTLISFIAFACKKDSVVEDKELLYITDSTETENILPVTGGELSIVFKWAFVEWEVIAGNVIEGEAFISSIDPANGGELDSGLTETTIQISYSANTKENKNSQEVIIRSLKGNKEFRYLLTQEANDYIEASLVIDVNKTYQQVSGFGGAAHMWIYGNFKFLTDYEMESVFGKDGLGLSIYRVRLSSVKSEWVNWVNTIKKANELGITVLASPWSPPAVWKSNGTTDGGGHLLEENYDDWIAYINEFIQYMADNGARVDVVSLQNEPDWYASYEGCEYTTSQMFNLVKYHAGDIVGAKVLAAESLNTNHAYTDPILNDDIAVNNIDIVGGHLYGSGLQPYPLAYSKGKELWMTEHLLNLDSGENPDNWNAYTSEEVIWDETIDMLTEIQQCMLYNWNAYIWWSIKRFYSFLGDGVNGTNEGEILKRGYAFSHFSKFIRPGYERIKADVQNVSNDVLVTAYKGEDSTVVVIVNRNQDKFIIDIEGLDNASLIDIYTTDLSKDCLKKTVLPTNNLLITIGSKSITTLIVK